jgi:hypothetical protein
MEGVLREAAAPRAERRVTLTLSRLDLAFLARAARLFGKEVRGWRRIGAGPWPYERFEVVVGEGALARWPEAAE